MNEFLRGLGMLIAYDSNGDVVATLDFLVRYDADGNPLGLVDFYGHEQAGGELTDIWKNDQAVGSKTWPEWLGSKAHDFRVELAGAAGRKHIAALVHKTTGVRRERASIEAAIAQRIVEADGMPADIRDIVGGPNRHIRLGDDGRNTPRPVLTGPSLPLIPVKEPKK